MKKLLLFILFIVLSGVVRGQVGRITYIEGRVVINSVPAKIGDEVFDYQIIKTHDKSVAEIQWTDGGRTQIESHSSYAIRELYEGRKSVNPDMFAGFKKVFTTAKASARAEEGGIRRSKVLADSLPNPDQMYWKEDAEVLFETASDLYEAGNYVRAAEAFKTFLVQKPSDVRSKYALFALGHCYAAIGNTQRAREIFEKFVVRYVGDDLRPQAESILLKL